MRKLTLALTVAALAAATLVPEANAYYSRRDVMRCDQNAAGNAVVGGIFGAVVGGIIGGATGNNPGLGAAIGAGAGGSIGLGMSCRDEAAYIDNVDRYLDDNRYDSPYSWNGGSVYVTRTFQRYDGVICHEYQTTVATRRGPMTKVEVACRERGGWMHGYHRGFDNRRFREMRDWRRHDRRDRDDRRDDRRRDDHRHGGRIMPPGHR